MRSKSLLCLSLLTFAWLLSGACSDSSGNHAPSPKNLASKDNSGHPESSGKSEPGIQDNPLAIPYVGIGKVERKGSASHCMRLDLKVEDPAKGSKYLNGSLVIANQCGSDMAILVNPVEVYLRRSETEFFVQETLVEPVYAVLYLFKADLGIGQNSFLGDGGLEVYGWPMYATILSHTDATIPLSDREGILRQLAPGDYGAMLSTLAAPNASGRSLASLIDLGMSVDRFNRKHRSGRVGTRPDSDRVTSTISIFHVSN